MKKMLILFILLFSLSCEKDDPSPVLTGTWNIYVTFKSGNSYDGRLIITQRDNGLFGNYEDDGVIGNYAKFLSSSKIEGNTVTIEWEELDYVLSFQGTVNSTYDSMSGSFYSRHLSGAYLQGTWLANKIE